MTEEREILNRFFVIVFNRILSLEDHAVAGNDISVNEVHIIDAVCTLKPSGSNTMKNIAALLSLTPGATSVAVGALVSKGYLIRASCTEDRRRVYILPTEAGLKAEERHSIFHTRMINAIEGNLNSTEFSALTSSLRALEEFFSDPGSCELFRRAGAISDKAKE